jgi:hypothetical protein
MHAPHGRISGPKNNYTHAWGKKGKCVLFPKESSIKMHSIPGEQGLVSTIKKQAQGDPLIPIR